MIIVSQRASRVCVARARWVGIRSDKVMDSSISNPFLWGRALPRPN